MSDDSVRELPMVCTCAPDDAARVREVRAWVKERLSAGSAALRPRLVTDADFLSALALSLHMDLGAHIADIYCDQWFLIAVDQRRDDGTERRVLVQADEAEDGLAAIWDYLNAEKDRPGAGSRPG
jgi:hypothetical protein